MKRVLKIIIPLLIIAIIGAGAAAFYYFGLDKMFEAYEQTDETYPRLANYYLSWELTEDESRELAKWDLIAMQPQVEEFQPGTLERMKSINPDATILAYQPMIETLPIYESEPDWTIAGQTYDQVNDNDWWLRSTEGEQVYWESIGRIIDITKPDQWQSWLPEFIKTEYYDKHPEYDGVIFDNVWFGISWLPDFEVDFDRDGVSDDGPAADGKWRVATKNILQKTKAQDFDKIVMGNINFGLFNNYLNGKMFENFGRNQELDWVGLMDEYWTNDFAWSPEIQLINQNPDNRNEPDNYRLMRFGLTSTLMHNGYYSYSRGDHFHDSLWWYDEYNVELGRATSAPKLYYELVGIPFWVPQNPVMGVWRRDFENGMAVVNPTDKVQTIKLEKEYQKIEGDQDPAHNDGAVIDQIVLQPEDGIILLNH